MRQVTALPRRTRRNTPTHVRSQRIRVQSGQMSIYEIHIAYIYQGSSKLSTDGVLKHYVPTMKESFNICVARRNYREIYRCCFAKNNNNRN